MERRPDTIAARIGAAATIVALTFALAILMTWPLARNMSGLGRSTGGGDGLYSVWNVAWVAHALTTDPGHLFDANIFFPHRGTLAYSEANLVAGAVALPAWWLTRSAYAAHNFALLAGFATALVGMWLLARRLTGHSGAAGVAACLYAFCPYLFAHTPHIQLLMAGGIPAAMLMVHRVADLPSPRRGAALGVMLAVQALGCAYYGIFAGLMVGYAVLFFAVSRKLWRVRDYWIAVTIGAAVSVAIVTPFFLPYLTIQEQGFRRTIEDSIRYSANAQSYLASPAHAHTWMLGVTSGWTRWVDALFPGFLAIALGIAGLVAAWRAPGDDGAAGRTRETAGLYGSLGALAFWASFGPAAGLYAVLFRLPLFSFLRAPARLGLIVAFALAVLAAVAIARVVRRWPARRGHMLAGGLAFAALVELNVLPFPWERAQPIPPVYAHLAGMPRGPVAEFPFYGGRVAYHLHTQYMLFSTAHWMPLVNGYSDHIPADFRAAATVLDSFPSRDTFGVLRRLRVRYIAIHWDMFGPRADEVRQRLQPFTPYLRAIGADSTMSLYEIVEFP